MQRLRGRNGLAGFQKWQEGKVDGSDMREHQGDGQDQGAESSTGLIKEFEFILSAVGNH